MPTIDPADIKPTAHRTPHHIGPRDDPLPPANGTSIIEAINGAVALLAPRRRVDATPRPACSDRSNAAVKPVRPGRARPVRSPCRRPPDTLRLSTACRWGRPPRIV